MEIAVLIPCYNEEISISSVICGFRGVLPEATIFVYDNNSSDRTIESARSTGAVVQVERLQGKGNVVRRMFSDIDADVYVLVDGDGTYAPSSAPVMVKKLLDERLDMVTAIRVSDETDAYRLGHRSGNRILTGLVCKIFGRRIGDMLSGYRVLSRRFVKSFPAMARGFETETELTVHALELRLPIGEVESPYCSRPQGSQSKLSTYKDGARILRMIARLIKEERPFQFFGFIAAVTLIIALLIGGVVVKEFIATGLVPRLPSAILATGMVLLSTLCFSLGIVLESVGLSRREVRRFAYLGYKSV